MYLEDRTALRPPQGSTRCHQIAHIGRPRRLGHVRSGQASEKTGSAIRRRFGLASSERSQPAAFYSYPRDFDADHISGALLTSAVAGRWIVLSLGVRR